MLWLIRCGVLELLECSVFVAQHGKVNFVVVVVPIKVDANVPVSYPIVAERVVGFEHSLEMHGMFTSDILDPKIIHNEGEPYWSPFMPP